VVYGHSWVFAVLTHNHLQDASSGFEGLRGVVLTKDHLAMFPDERSRIEKAGGHVTADGRLNGRMQVNRALILHAQERIV